MDTAMQVSAGNNLKFAYTMRQGYEAYLKSCAENGRAAGQAAGLQGSELDSAVDAAMEAVKLRDEEAFFGQFEGSFTVHRPSVGEMIQIDNHTALLSEQIPPSALRARGSNLAQMVATMKIVVEAAPPWWGDPLKLYNIDALQVAYWGYKNWVDSFRL